MENKFLKWGLFFIFSCGLCSLLPSGCFSEPTGVYCVTNTDCSSHDCYNGVCVGETIVADSETNTSNERSFRGVDILFVVDTTSAMGAEQGVASSSIFTLLNKLQRDIHLDDVSVDFQIRVAVTTNDMGIGYIGGARTEEPESVSCWGLGDNGKMRNTYWVSGYGKTEIPVKEELIECQNDDAACPADWVCTLMDQNGIGRCTPVYSDTNVAYPELVSYLTDDMYLSFESSSDVDDRYSDFVTAVACLANGVTGGCSIGRPLHAAYAAMTKHGQEKFLRKDAITLIVVVTDERDCSLGEAGFEEDKGSSTYLGAPLNGICNDDEQLLDPLAVRERIVAAKSTAIGEDAEDTIVFAAISGVPMVPACQGQGDKIDGCLGTVLPGGGTVGKPNTVERLDLNEKSFSDYEYACERVDEAGTTVTHAYPASRIVEVVHRFGDAGYVYSVCNKDWTPAMSAIGEMILDKMDDE